VPFVLWRFATQGTDPKQWALFRPGPSWGGLPRTLRHYPAKAANGWLTPSVSATRPHRSHAYVQAATRSSPIIRSHTPTTSGPAGRLSPGARAGLGISHMNSPQLKPSEVAAHGERGDSEESPRRRRGPRRAPSEQEDQVGRQTSRAVELPPRILGQPVQGSAHASRATRTRPAEQRSACPRTRGTCSAHHGSYPFRKTRRPRSSPSSRGMPVIILSGNRH
jgi:hypothetical protein